MAAYDSFVTDLHRLVAAPLDFVADDDPRTRRLAISACSGRVDGPVRAALETALATDPDPRVRAEAAEVISEAGPVVLETLLAATADPEGVVREAVATGLGELERDEALPWLLGAAAGDTDKLVREAAVAALGAIGDERAVPLLLELVSNGPPQVRRRSVVALSVFDGPNVEAAIHAARDDRNPMVREAAQMVVGH